MGALTGLSGLRLALLQVFEDRCHHDPLPSGPLSLPGALLAAQASPAQAVSVPPSPVRRTSFLSEVVLTCNENVLSIFKFNFTDLLRF